MPKLFDRLHIFVLTVDDRILQPRDVPCTSAMKERIRVDQNVVEARGFTNSSSLEIEITEPEGKQNPTTPEEGRDKGGKDTEKQGDDWTRGRACPSQQALVLKS